MKLDELISKVASYTDTEVEAILRSAYQIAADAHEGAWRRTDEPFINHPLAVANILAEWHAPPTVVAVGLLHDILNPHYSHGPGLDVLQKKLKPDVFRLLEATTNLNGFIRRFEEDFSRAAGADYSRDVNANVILHEATALVQERDAFVIKIADRLHNLQTISALPRELQKRTALIILHIFAPLAGRLGMGSVKRELENASLKIIYPIYYDLLEHHYADVALKQAVQSTRDELQHIVASFKPQAEVHWQPFSLYAIYHHQLEENARHGRLIYEGHLFLKLVDVGSFIILTDSEIDCYMLLGTLHTSYPPVEKQFHDFIGNHGENGYRSIHTQVEYSTGHLINAIIRTRTMHLVAEYGCTAQWRGVAQEVLPQLPAATRHTDNEIKVFTPEGEVRYLPQDAIVLDFAYDIHTDMGEHCIGAVVNGKQVDMYAPLQNGDRVEILVATETQPTPEWLKHVVTSHASNRIRHWLMQQSRQAMEERGRTALDRELQPLGLSSTDSEVYRFLTHLARKENLEGPEDILVYIGVGRWQTTTIVGRLKVLRSAHFIEPTLQVNVLSPESASLQRDFAHCCRPTPPDNIVGYRRKNGVLAIHRSTCPRIRNKKELISVKWEITPPEPDYVIVVEAINRAGLAADLSAVMKQLGIDMLRFDSHRGIDTGLAETFIYLGETTSLQRSRIQKELEAAPFVRRVEAIHSSELSNSYLPNPYGPQPALGSRFYGRERESQRLEALSGDSFQNSAIFLCGQKRIGKTSLLLHIEEHTYGKFFPVYIDMERHAYCTTTQFLHQLVHDIFQRLKTNIPDSMHSITVPHFNHFKLDALGYFDKFMARAQDVVQYQPVAVILDEFQYLCDMREEGVSQADIFNNLHGLLEYGHGFHLILSGGGLLSNFMEQANLASLLSICTEEKLGCLGRNAASNLIRNGLSRVSDLEEEAVDLLFSITAGHPYFLQVLCHKLYEQAQEEKTVITREFTSQAIDEWLARADEGYFQHLWTGNNTVEEQRNKIILSAIAELLIDTHEVTYDRLCKLVCPFIQERDLIHALEDLVYMGILKQDQLNYTIEVDLFARWLRRHRPLKLALKEAKFL